MIVPGERVPRVAGNRILFEDGVPVAVQSGGDTQYLKSADLHDQWEIRNLLLRQQKSISYLAQPRLPQ
jgi:ATP-dependent Lhr-like helicase